VFNYIGTVQYTVHEPWRVSMGCMDKLMDKNLRYFVGGNLATLLYIALSSEIVFGFAALYCTSF